MRFHFFIALSIFGVAGIFTRFLVNEWAAQKTTGFPLGTFVVNAVGSLLIGFIFVLFREKQIISELLLKSIVVGFLGGLTTFSSFSFEVLDLLQNGKFSLGFLYLAISPIVGLSLAWCGMMLGRMF